MDIIDFHAHAFPDELASRAIPHLEDEADTEAFLDGTLTSLLSSMDRAGIGKAVVASIATKPNQFDSILQWSVSIASERIVPFPSVHPQDPDALVRIDQISEAGCRGIKMHPYYQKFRVDEDRLEPIYERIRLNGLILLMHTGFDIAFDRYRVADPVKIMNVVRNFPDLKLVTSHLGAWQDWDEVERHLLGEPVYMDVSYTLQFMKAEKAKELVLAHPAGFVLFGTDSPWGSQENDVRAFIDMDLGSELTEALFYVNAARLLGDT